MADESEAGDEQPGTDGGKSYAERDGILTKAGSAGCALVIDRPNATGKSANEPRGKAFQKDDQLPMRSDDALALATRDTFQHLPSALLGRHLEPWRNGIIGAGMQSAAIVDAANIADHKPG